MLQPKEAVAAAKKQLIEIFSGEGIAPPTLEEIWYDEVEQVWVVTLGVRRVDQAGKIVDRLGLRDYKAVRVSDKDGSVVAIRDRFNDALAQ
jgi:hypothetical protein